MMFGKDEGEEKKTRKDLNRFPLSACGVSESCRDCCLVQRSGALNRI
jgi:hypothetical protein